MAENEGGGTKLLDYRQTRRAAVTNSGPRRGPTYIARHQRISRGRLNYLLVTNHAELIPTK